MRAYYQDVIVGFDDNGGEKLNKKIKFMIVFNSMIHKDLTLFYLIKVKFLLNRLNLFFGRMNLISNFAAPKGT
jgi:hypothetical protein